MPVDLETEVNSFNWLLANFVRNTDGIRDAVAVSSDGLLIATSEGLDRTGADHLAAIVSSLSTLGRSASRRYDFEALKLIMIEMRRGFLLVSRPSAVAAAWASSRMRTATSGSSATRSPCWPSASATC